MEKTNQPKPKNLIKFKKTLKQVAIRKKENKDERR